MNKFKFNKIRTGVMTIKVQSHAPEKFINLLWKNGIIVKNIKKININTLTMDIYLRDYNAIRKISKKSNTVMKIISRRGISFIIIKERNRIAVIIGILLFIFLPYYLSRFIWKIDIITEHNVAPYEIRQQLRSYGIIPGINKNNINIYNIEERLIDDNEDIMWARVRVDGARLKVNVAERQSPPQIKHDDTPCNLVAKKDGQIVSVYTSSGTAVVKPNDIVKKGQVLINGMEGKEGSTTLVHARAKVIARTFYESQKDIPISGFKDVKTGKQIVNYYIQIGNKKINITNNLNKFQKYDKIIKGKFILKKEIIYEVKKQQFFVDSKKIVKKTADDLYNNLTVNFDRSVNFVDRKVEAHVNGNICNVKLYVIAEEDICEVQNIS